MNRLLAVAIGLCLFEAATGPTSASQPHDLVYVIDSTERMGDVFDDVRAFVSQHALALQSASGDLRIAIVDYKDRGDVYVANKLDFVVYASVGEATGISGRADTSGRR